MSQEEIDEKSLSVVIAFLRFDGLDFSSDNNKKKLECTTREWINVPLVIKSSIAKIKDLSDKKEFRKAFRKAVQMAKKEDADVTRAAEKVMDRCLR